MTAHHLSQIVTQSPTLNGLDVSIENDANKSDNIFCKAKAIAIPQIHKLAIKGDTSIPRFTNNNNNHITHTITFTASCIAF